MSLPMLRTSERASFKRCPLAWDWYWNQGWRRGGKSPNALWFGTGVHLAFADWYIPGAKRGIDPRETWAKYCREEIRAVKVDRVNPLTDEQELAWTDARDLGDHVLGHYLERYGNDESWDVIAREQTFGVRIPHPVAHGAAITSLRGTFDGVYRDLEDGLVKLMEHKTSSNMGTGHLTIDDQGGTYCTVSTFTLRKQGLIGPKDIVEGITYNFIRKAYKDDRPKNEKGLHTNLPEKKHYVEAFLGSSDPAVIEAVEQHDLNEKRLMKLTLAQLSASAEKYGLKVLGDVSKTQPLPYFDRPWVERNRREQLMILKDIGSEALAMSRFRSGEQPIYKTPRYDCEKFCDYFEVCEVRSSGGDYKDLLEQLYHKEDPYADHRKSAGE